MKIRRHHLLAGFGVALFFSSPLPAQDVVGDVGQFASLVRDYNLVTLGNADLSFINNDTEGPLAIGGDLTVGGVPLVNFSQYRTSTDPTLYVQGQLTVTNGTTAMLNNGYASLPAMAGSGHWASTGGQYQYTTPAGGILSTTNAAGGNAKSTQDPRTNAAPANWNTAAIKSTAVAISNDLASRTATGTIAVDSGQNLVFSAGGNTGVVVFNLAANLLNGSFYNNVRFSSIKMDIAKDTEFVVNLNNAAGKTIFGTSGVNFNAPGGTAGASQLLWNIVNPSSTDIQTTLGNGGQFYGSALAPMVNLANATNAVLNGQILTDTITYSNAELHDTTFVAIPEPAAWTLLLGVATFGVLAIGRQRRIAA